MASDLSRNVHLIGFCHALPKMDLGLIAYLLSRRSVWENLDRGHEYGTNVVRSLHTTEVKILPYRQAVGLSSVNKMFIIWQTREI